MNRRELVRNMCYGGIATFAAPRVSFAQVAQNGRLVFVLLRGGSTGSRPSFPTAILTTQAARCVRVQGV